MSEPNLSQFNGSVANRRAPLPSAFAELNAELKGVADGIVALIPRLAQ